MPADRQPQRIIAVSAVLMWHRADTSLSEPQGSLSGIGNQLTGYVAAQVASAAAAVLE